jgi:hypothetical protein
MTNVDTTTETGRERGEPAGYAPADGHRSHPGAR